MMPVIREQPQTPEALGSPGAAGARDAADATVDGPAVFRPFRLGGLTLRNHVIRSGCFEGMSPGGQVTERLIEHHRRVAAGGVGMTTVSYCSVSFDGRAFGHELWMRPEIVPGLRALAEAVHAEGAAASIQLGHCGFFASPTVIGRRPLGASPKVCLFRLSYCREMTQADIEEKTQDFVQAALLAREAGFDAVELHSGHGYLLNQFLSPWTNRRRDQYGGSLENRMRFPVAVVRQVRAALGPEFPVLVKMNMTDGMRGGLQLDEAVRVAAAYEAAGATALVPSCGFTAKTPLYMMRGGVPVLEMARAQEKVLTRIGMALFGWVLVQRYPFERCFQRDEARLIRQAVSIPVGYVGGVRSLTEMESLLAEGFAFVQIGRPTVRDPDYVLRLERGQIRESDCDHCNRCIASMSVTGVTCACSEEEARAAAATLLAP
jgi:2,4-dienoyl-CoA reductase-like NADH-dependent reductase (Old Yellow Enzyme family)